MESLAKVPSGYSSTGITGAFTCSSAARELAPTEGDEASREHAEGEVLRELEMRPRAEDSQFAEVVIRVAGTRMTAVEQLDRKGNRVQMTIREFTVNPEIDEKALRLEVPEGTRVIRHAAKGETGEGARGR